MSSIANLQRLPASELSKILLAEQEAATNPTIAVVDVRDDGTFTPALLSPVLISLPLSCLSLHSAFVAPPPSPSPTLSTPVSAILTPLLDRIGGHIKNSIHAPSNTLDAKMPTLVRQLADKKTVVFHCALSQQRGPSAAIKYVRERERMFPRRHKDSTTSEKKDEEPEEEEQKIYVLDQGFVGWQQVYADDERLTEGYRKEIWENGY